MMDTGLRLRTFDTVNELKTAGFRLLVWLPGGARIQGLLLSSFLKLLFIPVLFALTTYAVDYSDVRSLKSVLDPVLYKVSGVQGSMIGTCVHGSEEDPFRTRRQLSQSIDMCLVYFAADDGALAHVRKVYRKLGLETSS